MEIIRNAILKRAVKNLNEYGYPDCNMNNIFTDQVYSAFFKRMLEDNLGQGIDPAIRDLIARIKPA